MERRINIVQGEHATGKDPDVVISTLLGSCVSCCLWDPEAGVGGMNHMLLAKSNTSDGMSNLAGINAMEVLINDLIKLGAVRSRLKAKAFGGARMVAGLSEVGRANAEFTLDFLQKEGIECVGQSLGGESARNLKFWPTTGKVMQRQTQTKIEEKVPEITQPDEGNDLELL